MPRIGTIQDANMKCVLRMLYVLNTIFLLIGVAIITMGATIHAVYSEFEYFIESHYLKPVELLISVGVIVMLISFIGYIGTFKRSTLLINLYALLLSLMLIVETALAILGIVMSNTIYSEIKSNMVDSLNDYNKDYEARQSWNVMQERLYCCGVYSPYNWESKDVSGPSVTLGNYTFTVPQSCCEDFKCSEIYGRGCLSVLGKYASDSTITITCCATFVLIIQIFGVIFACILAQTIRRAKTQEEMRRQQNRQLVFDQLVNGQQEKVVSPVLYTPESTEA